MKADNDPVVDIHAHMMPASAKRAHAADEEWHGSRIERARNGGPRIVTGSHTTSISPGYWEPTTARIPAVRSDGVDVQALSPAPAFFRYYVDPSDAQASCREVNDELAELTQHESGAFAGLAIVPLQDVTLAIEELRRVVEDLGLMGVAVGTHVDGENWDSPRLLPFLQAAQELQAVVFFHPHDARVDGALPRYHMNNFIGMPYETTVAVGSLIFGGVLDVVPDVRLVFAHGGGFSCSNIGRFGHGSRARPEAQQMRRAPDDYVRHLFFDSLTHSERSLRYLLDVVGADRVVLGTDFPADMSQARPVAWLTDCGSLTEEERHLVLRGNATRLMRERTVGTTTRARTDA